MRLSIKHNIDEVTKGMSSMQKKQIPFATMLALNDTAFDLQRVYKAQTKQKFDQPTKFTQTGFAVKKAKKTDLTAVVFVTEKREDYMKLQVDGGVRHPKNNAIIIPNKSNSSDIDKYASGNLTKGAVNKIKKQKDKYFFGIPKGNQGSEGIWERYGRTATGSVSGARIRQVAKLSKQAKYKALFPFTSIGNGVAFSRSKGFDSHFAKRLRFALNTAR
jgi:hypothetical protein